MKQVVLKRVGHSWVAVVYKNGAVVDWRKATAAEIMAAHK